MQGFTRASLEVGSEGLYSEGRSRKSYIVLVQLFGEGNFIFLGDVV